MSHRTMARQFVLASSLATLPAVADPAAADDPPTLEVKEASVTLQPAPEDPVKREELMSTAVRRYGSEGSLWWSVGGGIGSDLADSTNGNVFGSICYFIVDNFEVQGELGGWYFDQPGDDALGINPVLNFRWHFLHREKWTMFGELGVGVLAATSDVPEGGTSFNLTPRAGVGFTYEMSPSGLRFLAGVRWQHFSNARINGDDENPALDEPFVYAGVVFPF